MSNNKDALGETLSANRFLQFIRKNGFSILMGIVIVLMLVSPNTKSWVLRQLMSTGFFNASIEDKKSDAASLSAIDFDFEDDKGGIQNTSSLRGKVVFINFWASWCPPCRAEFPSIEALYSNFKNDPGIFFLTINEDENLIAAKAYLEKEKFSVPFYQIKAGVPEEIYTGVLPTTVVLDKNGKVRYKHEGFARYNSQNFIKQVEALINE